jgi:hypothetical protein
MIDTFCDQCGRSRRELALTNPGAAWGQLQNVVIGYHHDLCPQCCAAHRGTVTESRSTSIVEDLSES